MKQFSGVPRTDLKWTPASPPDFAGKKVAVVGGTSGIGQAFARLMAKHGASVTVVGQTFRDEGTPELTFMKADLSSMAEARRVGEALPDDLDLVVLTTGIMAAPKREETAEGVERDMAVSYLSRYAIVGALAPRLKPRARVFVMGFPGTGQPGDPTDLNGEKAYVATTVHMNT